MNITRMMNVHAAGINRRQGRLQDGERSDQTDRIHAEGEHVLENSGRRAAPGESISNCFDLRLVLAVKRRRCNIVEEAIPAKTGYDCSFLISVQYVYCILLTVTICL